MDLGFNGRYILNEQGNPMPEPDLLKWAQWMETPARRVELTVLDSGARISTVFLGLDHNFSPMQDPLTYKPVLWETMAFEQGTHRAMEQERYTSEEAARAGHWLVVELVKAAEAVEAAELRELIHQEGAKEANGTVQETPGNSSEGL